MIRRTKRLVAIGMVMLAACQSKAPPAVSDGMTPEEHAKMLAGGTQGVVDSAGLMIRQAVYLTSEQERALGVIYATVTRETLGKTVRTVGTIQTPEPNLTDVTLKVGGFVETLMVNSTGGAVERGQPMFTIYSPELVAAQEEYLAAQRLVVTMQGASATAVRDAQAMLNATHRRLTNWDVSEQQLAELMGTGIVSRTTTVVAPASGIVLTKEITSGQQVMPGQRLYQIADLRNVWVEGEVFEQDIALVKLGMPVHIEIAARPGEHLMGKVSFIYPTVDAVSRTNRVRLTVPNVGLRLKPGMFATIYFDAIIGKNVVVVPRAAVVVTGVRNLVFVRDANGMLQPREVVLGGRSSDRVEVLSGLSAGETIVASANFLVDSESRLGSSGSSMPGMQHSVPTKPDSGGKPQPPEQRHDQ